jgi:WD40 repeat protein
MDRTNNTCPHCGRVQPKDNSLICGVCGEQLEGPTEKATTFFRPSEPRHSQRRRLILGLVLGSVSLAALGSGVGAVLLGERGLLGTSSSLPIDRHCVLNLPFDEAEQTMLVWLSDNTHLLGFDLQTLFLLDVKGGKKDWVQPITFPLQGQPLSQILWSPNGRYVAAVGYPGSVGDDMYQAVVWDIQSKQRIWTSPPRGHVTGSLDSSALTANGAFVALCQDAGAHHVEIWDIQKN